MKRAITLMLAMTMMTGCAFFDPYRDEGIFILKDTPNACGSTGYTYALVTYGDSHIAGLPLSTVHAGAEFRLVLKPISFDSGQLSDLEDRTVKITGKSAGPGDDWLSGSGTGADETIVICVPDDTEPGDYSYLINIDGIGTLDPRVHVIGH